MKQLWKIIVITKSLWRYYSLIGFFTVSLAAISLLLPFFTGLAIDEIRKGADSDVSYVVWLAFGILLVEISTTLLSNIGGFFGDRMAVRVNRILGASYFGHLMSLPQSYFDKELSGKIINRLTRSISQISIFLNTLSNNFLQFIFSTIFALIIVAYYSWQVALMLASLYPIYLFLTVRTSPKWQAYQQDKNEQYDIANGRFAEVISQVRVTKSYIQEKRELRLFNRHMAKAVKIDRPQSIYWHKHDTFRRVVLNLIFFAIYLFIFVEAARGSFTPGQAVALILYANQIRIPIFTISFLVDNTQRAIADSRDYFEILDIKPEIIDRPGALTLNVNEPRLKFDNVVFGYDESSPVLKGISFEALPGTKVALVGESGQGKTTLTNLLMRLYEPNSGQILIDGQDIGAVTQSSLRSQIGVVFQEPALFSGTIMENIAYANPKSSDKEVIAAAVAANADDFISQFNKGYQTQIGERGLRLSGGQKQRIAIARALLKNAPILILDEATSSLDSRSESMVQKALDRLMKGRTTIIIAHRLSTIADVDMIVTLENGKISACGSPQKLSRQPGVYADLLALQAKGSDPVKLSESLKKYDIET